MDQPKGVPVCVVDAFTAQPFRGNPAAVCFLQSPAAESWMQNVARELNLSETAFSVPTAEPDCFHLRWFTPEVEVDLCGHATMAAAHATWERGLVPAGQEIRFQTRSGFLRCKVHSKGISMDFPARPAAGCTTPAGLEDALGCRPAWVGRTPDDYLVELEQAQQVRDLGPDLTELARLPVRGTIITAASDDPAYDFISRFFAPGAGVPEDPVTGSAHCSLAPFWARRLGREELRGWQASRRGGEVQMRLRQDRVDLGGQAVTVWRGELV